MHNPLREEYEEKVSRTDMKELLWKVVNAYASWKHEAPLDEFLQISLAAYHWLMKELTHHWARHLFQPFA